MCEHDEPSKPTTHMRNSTPSYDLQHLLFLFPSRAHNARGSGFWGSSLMTSMERPSASEQGGLRRSRNRRSMRGSWLALLTRTVTTCSSHSVNLCSSNLRLESNACHLLIILLIAFRGNVVGCFVGRNPKHEEGYSLFKGRSAMIVTGFGPIPDANPRRFFRLPPPKKTNLWLYHTCVEAFRYSDEVFKVPFFKCNVCPRYTTLV